MPVEGVMLEPPALSTLVIASLGKLTQWCAGRTVGGTNRRGDGGRMLNEPRGHRTDDTGDHVRDRMPAGSVTVLAAIFSGAGRRITTAHARVRGGQVSPVRSAGIGSVIESARHRPRPEFPTTTV